MCVYIIYTNAFYRAPRVDRQAQVPDLSLSRRQRVGR